MNHPGCKTDLRLHKTEGAYVISTHVLQEFYSIVTRRFSKKMEMFEEDGERATRSSAHLPVVTADAHLVLDAISLSHSSPSTT